MEDFSAQQIKTLTAVMEGIVQTSERNLRDFVDQKIQASENRMKVYVNEKLDEAVQSISHTIDAGIQPQLDKHDYRLTKLEAKPA
jgi:hypothetical protein